MINSIILIFALLTLRIIVYKLEEKFIHNDSSSLVFSVSCFITVLFLITILTFGFFDENVHLTNLHHITNTVSLIGLGLGVISLVLNLFMYATKKYPTFIINKLLRRIVKLALLIVVLSSVFLLVQFGIFAYKI